jgi:hypothetical protein
MKKHLRGRGAGETERLAVRCESVKSVLRQELA